ncbi:hypothetical protein MVEN_01049900 [Mycena venus]|uniref:SH3 domain-containing protein n=1 Tax=Mycena venus TaxID=2733690 RepID=A0A8H7CZ94_9AGAR|nr:hypothetical protein MVEN_01049900 [Mycena venus]
MDVADRTMDAAELARWTRFAAKGGIGKCTAVGDCVAEAAQDLMFLKNDEIVVLMQLPEENMFLGYCEGIVGRFHANDVHFHSKLKKPVMTKRSSVGGTHSGKSTPTPSVQSPSPSLVQSSSPRSGMNYHQTSPSPQPQSQLRYQPPSPPLSPSSSRERMPRNTSFSSTTVSTGSTSASMSSSTISSVSPETPLTMYSSPEPVKGWPKPLDTSTSTASMDTNVSGRSSTYMASVSSVNGLDTENDEGIDGRHNRRSETTTVEIWPSSPPSATIARKPVNGSRLALAMQPPTDSEESDEEVMENGHSRGNSSGSDHEEEEHEYGPDDGTWATHHGGTLPLQVVKINSPNPNSVPPSPYRQAFSSSPLAQNDHDSTRSDSRPDSVNHNDSSRSTDSESNYNTTESEDNADETMVSVPTEKRSPSPPNHGSSHHPTPSVSSSTHDGSMLYGNTTNSLVHEDPTRSSIAAPSFHGSEDGEVGIGLSLLQGLVGGDGEASDSDEDESPSAGTTPEKRTSRRQSTVSAMRGTPQHGDDWDGASIYENYYRFSTNPRASTSTFASGRMPARFSHSSQRGMPNSNADVVPPVPVDSRHKPESIPSQTESNRSEKTRSIDSDASVYTQASKISSIDPSRLSVQPPHGPRRPAPLELTSINGEPSPLLHTRWGSPASSASPPTSSAAGQSSFYDGTPPVSASSGSISPGGVASQLRQRLEIDRGSPIGSFTRLDAPGEGLGGGIVIEDDEEPSAPSMSMSITSDPRSESPEEESEAEVDDDVTTRRPGPDSLAPLVINDTLSPPANSIPPASTNPSPSPQSSTATTPPFTFIPSRSPSSSASTDPPAISAPDSTVVVGASWRTSMFLPHPNAPKPPPMTGGPEGPLYIRQPPPPSQQRSDNAQSLVNVINMSIGRSKVTRVMPTIYGRTELDLGSSTGPVRMVFSMDPLPPLSAPLPSQIPFRNGASPPVPPPPGPVAVPRRMTSESDPGNTSQPGSPVGSPRSPMPGGRSPSGTASPVTAVPGKSSPTC